MPISILPRDLGQECRLVAGRGQGGQLASFSRNVAPVPTQQRLALAVDLDLGFTVDRGVQWDLHANRRTCMYPYFGPIQLQDKFRVAVGNQRRLVEPRGGVDHCEHPQPSRHPVEVAQCALQAAEVRQRDEPRGLVPLLTRDLSANTTKWLGQRAV